MLGGRLARSLAKFMPWAVATPWASAASASTLLRAFTFSEIERSAGALRSGWLFIWSNRYRVSVAITTAWVIAQAWLRPGTGTSVRQSSASRAPVWRSADTAARTASR